MRDKVSSWVDTPVTFMTREVHADGDRDDDTQFGVRVCSRRDEI